MTPYITAALYKFVDLPDYQELQEPLKACCDANNIKGSLLLATEGINGTIAGTREEIKKTLDFIRKDPRLADLVHREYPAAKMPFPRMKVKLKKEIVTFGVENANPNKAVGTYIKPEDWNAIISDPEVFVIDTRNDYEVGIGTFKNAVDPDIKAFSSFPDYIKENMDPKRHKKVAMFCTGGIRCEKASSYMLQEDFETVYHLEGGILNYLATIPESESLWEGDCFVFDHRVAFGNELKDSSYALDEKGMPARIKDLA